MSFSASIDICTYEQYTGSELCLKLIKAGWTFNVHGLVTYLSPKDRDEYNWITVTEDSFDLHKFLKSHSNKDKVGIIMAMNEIEVDFVFTKGKIMALLQGGKLFLNSPVKIIDFNCYLSSMVKGFSDESIENIQCFQNSSG